jgi:hypothetical protein
MRQRFTLLLTCSIRGHIVIDEADEAQLVGVSLDNGQMLDRVRFESGR